MSASDSIGREPAAPQNTPRPTDADALRSWRTDRLRDSLLYVCIDARRDRDPEARAEGWGGEFPALRRNVRAAFAGGVDIVQLRDKGSAGERESGPLEALHELTALRVLREEAEAAGALFAVNDRADIALASGADVMHLGQDDLPVAEARRILGPGPIIGRSCHADAEVDVAAADPEVDYFCTGPTWPTPTKPGREAPGLPLVAHAAQVVDAEVGAGPAAKPWFAIGGIDAGNLAEVTAAGASRVVVVRAVTGAADPSSAARELRELLEKR
ncbi:thiamine phosphate synthase [Dietzia sp.]|uniref:thiamine phosphate synthase n=1 Tax=Dietzia sp. TaxID=1871616 RepID=UPI002FDB3866